MSDNPEFVAPVAQWRSTGEKPLDKQACHIRGGDRIIVGVLYSTDLDGWVDLFATPEAGASWQRIGAGVDAWMPESDLDLDTTFDAIVEEKDNGK